MADTADTRFADLAVTLSEHVATVEIQRPPANYFDLALIDALASAYEYLEVEPDCRAIALSADLRVGEPASWFAFNFARLGIHQGFGISATLPRVTGQQKALELLYTARRIKGPDALAAGLFDRLAEPGELRKTAQGLAGEIAAAAPLAVQRIRLTMRAALLAEVKAAHPVEAQRQRELFGTRDFRRGVDAAARREDPIFEGD